MMREIARGTNGSQTPSQGTNEVFNGDLSTAEITNPTEITFDDFVRGITEDRTKAREFLKSLSNEARIKNLSKLFENPFGGYYTGKPHWRALNDALNAMEETTKQRILNDGEIISAIGKGVDKCLEKNKCDLLERISSLLHNYGDREVAEKIFQDRQEALEKIATKYLKDDVYYIVSNFAELVVKNNLTKLKTSIQKALEEQKMQDDLAKELCRLFKIYHQTEFVSTLIDRIETLSSSEMVKNLLKRDDVKKAFEGCLNKSLDSFNFTNATELLSIIEKYELEDLTKVVEEKFKLDENGDNKWFRELSKYASSRFEPVGFLDLVRVHSFLEKRGILDNALNFFNNEQFLTEYEKACKKILNSVAFNSSILLAKSLGLESALANVIRGNNLIGDLREDILDSLRKGSIEYADIKLSFIKEYKLGDVEIAKLQEAIGSYLTSCADNTAINEMTDDTAKEIRLFAEKYDVDLKPFHRIINELGVQEQLLPKKHKNNSSTFKGGLKKLFFRS